MFSPFREPRPHPPARPGVLPEKRAAGFSLVEVVLALAVIAFAVVALLGLLTVSAGSSRSSDEATMIASMSRQIIAEIRSKPFTSLLTAISPTDRDPGWPIAQTTTDLWPVEAGDPPSPPPTYIAVLFFDNEGRRLSTASGGFYQCRVKMMADPKSLTVSTNTLLARTNLYRVQLTFLSTQGARPVVLQTVRTALSRDE